MLVKIANRELIRLLLQKQSDLGLYCLSRPFGRATSIQNFRTFAVTQNRIDNKVINLFGNQWSELNIFLAKMLGNYHLKI